MASDIDIFDWPLIPSASLFYAGGQALGGGFTLGGSRTLSPEPGGRAAIDMAYNHTGELASRRLASWLFSKGGNGTVFRVPLVNSLQLVSYADLGLADPGSDIPWSNGELWSNGQGWASSLGAEAAAAGDAGSTTLVIDMSIYGLEGLLHGHVIGHNDHAYMVEDIAYDDGIATVTVSPPLREDVEAGDFIRFRPYMIGTIEDIGSFRALFEAGFLVQPGGVTIREAIT